MIRYYFFKCKGKVFSAYRIDVKSNPQVLDWWDEKENKWVYKPEVIDVVSGYSSDWSNYDEVTKKEVDDFISSRIKKEKAKKRVQNKTK